MTEQKRILILGGGFAGAYAALHLEKRTAGETDVEITLVARENFVLFTPMLHEVAGCYVAPTDIVQPLRKMLRRTHVLVGDVDTIDLSGKRVHVARGDLACGYDLTYEQLVIALGSVTNFFRTPGLEEYCFTMKTLGDAILARNRVIDMLEVADNESDETECKAMLTVVVAGGGFAGVETAGAVNDYLREAERYYHNVKGEMVRVILVHDGEVLLPELTASLGRYAHEKLVRRGVEIRMRTKVAGYDGNEVALNDGTKIATRMLIWTAGSTPPELLSSLPCAMQRNRILTNEFLQVPGWPGVWALGDCAAVPDLLNPGTFHPPTAQHATRQAVTVANNIAAVLSGRALRPVRFRMIGMLATTGWRTGVAEIFGIRFSGIIAWWLWRSIYLIKLPGLQKKVRVAFNWTLDLIFSKDIVQLRMLGGEKVSKDELSLGLSPEEESRLHGSERSGNDT
jgi:NADH dehydrogenase